MTKTKRFKVGDKVVDRDGYRGRISKITDWEGSHWYDVSFAHGRGGAVRYEDDLEFDLSEPAKVTARTRIGRRFTK